MAEIVNLRHYRKTRAKDAAGKAGTENAVRFGRRKDDKANEAAELELAAKRLDGHIRDVSPEDDDDRP
ncbi:MAG: hypothetical protein ACJAVR_001095 [Paracoccaceae bacterium]|jgi:hypothetical protein